ncbi:hypothetical protein [Streptomyces sp. NPDC049949]|uniref:hypothetical protein n=1 Tax=Streptomyces sp. NPDC049949 TaxID=3154627 RepID=UPI003432B8FB
MGELDDYAAKMAARFYPFGQDGDGHITRRDFRLMAERAARAFDVADGPDQAAGHDGDRRVTVNTVDFMLVAFGAEAEQARRLAAEHRTDPAG